MLATLYRCPECGYPSIGMAGYPTGIQDARTIAQGRQDQWLPRTAFGKAYGDGVPNAIAGPADEAHQCFSIGAYRSAILLARSVIEAICKDNVIEDGQLFHKIEALHERGLVNAHLKDAAHEIRDLGNEMAHGDFGTEVTEEDARDILDFMGDVLEEIYQRPHRIAVRRALREEQGRQAQTEIVSESSGTETEHPPKR